MKVSPRAEYLRNVLWATRWIQCCYVSHSVFPTNNFGHCALLEHGFRFIFFWLSLIFLPCFEPQNFISPPAPPFWMADQVDEAGTHLPLGRAPNTSTHVSKDSKFQIHRLKFPIQYPKWKIQSCRGGCLGDVEAPTSTGSSSNQRRQPRSPKLIPISQPPRFYPKIETDT